MILYNSQRGEFGFINKSKEEREPRMIYVHCLQNMIKHAFSF